MHDTQEQESHNTKSLIFICPNCGEIPQDDVVFLCNTCKQNEIILQDGVYMCPQCMIPGPNFECMRCESKEVALKTKIEN